MPGVAGGALLPLRPLRGAAPAPLGLIRAILQAGAAEDFQPLPWSQADAHLARGQFLVDNHHHRLAAGDPGGQQLALTLQVVTIASPGIVEDDDDRVKAEAELPVKQDSLPPPQ